MNDPLKGLFTQYWLYLAVRAACKIDLFETVRDRHTSEAVLCDALNTHPIATRHLTGALLHYGFLQSDNGVLQLTPLSERLTADHPKTMKYACLLWGGEHMDVWQQLDSTIQTGEPAFNKLFGLPFFDFLNRNPVHSEEYHLAMFEYARDDYNRIAGRLNISESKSILDVGGANGALALEMQRTFPDIQVAIYDLEDRRHATALSIRFIKGDFFVEIPEVADTIVLSRVLHDWPDRKALDILANCQASLPVGGKLIVVENDLSRIGDGAHLLSLNMMAVCASFERSDTQYAALIEANGFSSLNMSNHNHLIIIEAWKF
jgi:C-methyltransferase